MPFTPFHFGPHACVSLPLYRHIDVPIFISANIAIDLEPLIVMIYNFDYPLHGYCHTLLIGSFVGFVFATAAFPLRHFIREGMSFIRLPYKPTYLKMLFSGILGAWLHILFDAVLYLDIRPFFPFQGNPLYGILTHKDMYVLCLVCYAPALLLFLYIVFSGKTAIENKS
jgi:membrane-bound metal-dependent hydrolase YbcI (DUF457 family)